MIFEILMENNMEMTAKQISKKIGCSMRDVSRMVEYERKHGAPILAGCNGYGIAADSLQMLQYCKALESRIRHTRQTLYACKKTAERMASRE